MRISVEFLTRDGEPDPATPRLATQLPGSPVKGQLVNFNGYRYTVEDVEWNGDPQPMRRDDLTIWVKPR